MLSIPWPHDTDLIRIEWRNFTKVLLSFVLLIASNTSHADISGVPPEVLAQLKTMPPSQQRALAKQYGIDLDSVLSAGVGEIPIEGEKNPLGAPGVPLEQVQRVDLAELLAEGTPRQDEAGKEEVLKRFGSNLFDSEVSTFAPVDNIPVPEGYRLGVGDELQVMLIGKEQGDLRLVIGRDGAVTLPKLGGINLSGLSFSEAKIMIEKRVEQQLIGSQAIVSMGSLRSINVFMAGEFKNPGNYSISALSTLSQSIFMAGGIADTGTYRAVELKREGKTVQSFDLYDLLLFGDNSGDARLQSGDVVFIPVRGPLASISGEVVRPAVYEFTDGETIGGLLDMAGGVVAKGNPQQALLRRYRPGESLPFIENLNMLEKSTLAKQALDGDDLFIASMSKRVSNPIAIDGETELDDLYGWSEGLRIADIFKDLEADVEPTADLNLSLIVRRKNNLNDIEVLPFSLTEALLEPISTSNVTLKPFDRIVILPQATAVEDSTLVGLEEEADQETEEEEETRQSLIKPIVEQLERQTRSRERARVINVSGAVREPGLYPLIGDGEISDAIALAGGFTDAAYLERVEVRRILISEDRRAEVDILNINLNELAEQDFKLIGRDTLRINAIPNWSTEQKVELSGEVLFPGSYTIFEGETIAELIERAGGFTGDAFLKGARYFSSAARASQSRQLKKIADSMKRRISSRESAGELGTETVSATIESVVDEDLLGRVVIDLQAIVDGDATANTIVDDGDSLFVPKYTNTVIVVGEVYEPGAFRFEVGQTLEEYIQIAGGATNYALKKNAYLLKADGSVQFYRSNALRNLVSFRVRNINKIEAGDAIVIPVNLDYDPPLTRVTAITNVVFQSLTSIAAFLNITNQ